MSVFEHIDARAYCWAFKPISTKRRIASERVGIFLCLALQASTFSTNASEATICNRSVIGSSELGGVGVDFFMRHSVTQNSVDIQDVYLHILHILLMSISIFLLDAQDVYLHILHIR